MFDRHKVGERAVLVQVAPPSLDAESHLAEFYQLACSAGADILATVQGTRAVPEPKYYIGLGKAEEVKEQVLAHAADLVLVNHELSPSQERNLERLLSCRVLGRTGLILDIFAQRARTAEGKLQVELAQLQHLSTRLVRGWTHLERQKGGIGLRGPGETQLETDRRLLRDRIKLIEQRLEKLCQQREQQRRARKKSAMPVVSIVGYTNAGKSSLFNALTGATTYVADQLFATLDSSMRKLNLPGYPSVILADTVGFIRHLPHQLVAAFHATLEETVAADLLLHVMDAMEPNLHESRRAVEQVLAEIGADKIKQIQVFNKIDGRADWEPMCNVLGAQAKVWVSALTGAGLDDLREVIASQLYGELIEEDIVLDMSEAKRRAELYEMGLVVKETIKDNTWRLRVRLSPAQKK